MCVDSMKTLALDLYHFGIKVLQLMVTVLELDFIHLHRCADALYIQGHVPITFS